MKEPDTMARGTTDPETVDAEMQGAQSPADAPPLTDEEWEAAAPKDGTPEDADLPKAEGDDEDDDEDEPRDGKQKSMFADLEPPDINEPLEFNAQLLKVSDASGSQGDNIQAHFEAPWTEVLNVANRYKKALEIRFGNVSVIGASVKSQSTNTDADGNVRFKVTFTIPESQKQRASELFMLTGRGGPLSIEPTQLSLDGLLTTRAEDEPVGTFSDVDEEGAEAG